MQHKFGLFTLVAVLFFSSFVVNADPVAAHGVPSTDPVGLVQQTATPKVGVKVTVTGNGAANAMLSFQNAIPSAWRSANATSARYDVKLNGSMIQVQTCRYQQGHSIVRRRVSIIASIVDLTTNRTIASRTFSGGTPAACLQRELFRQGVAVNYKDGASPSASEFKTWVQTALKLK